MADHFSPWEILTSHRTQILDKLKAAHEDWNAEAAEELAGTLGIEFAEKIRERLGKQMRIKTISIAKAFNQKSFEGTDAGARAACWVEIRTREVAKLCVLAADGLTKTACNKG